MDRLIESDSFETRITNMLEDGFQDTGWNSHVFYELDDLIEKGYIGDMDKDSSNPNPDLPEDMSEANEVFISNPSEVKNKSIGKVRSDIYVEKLSQIPPGGYIYPLDSTTNGYRTDFWNTQLGYKNPDGKKYVDYLFCKKDASGSAISSVKYNYYESIFSCDQPYEVIVGTKPCFTYDGAHSFTSPSSNILKYGVINGYAQFSWQSCIQNYAGSEFVKLKSNLVNAPDGFKIKGYDNKVSAPYLKIPFTAKSGSKYTVSFYVKSSTPGCRISIPNVCQEGSDVFNNDIYDVTKEWTRVSYTTPEILNSGTSYNILVKWTNGYNDSSKDLKICGIVCEPGETPTLYTSNNQSYLDGHPTDSYHQVIALNLIDTSTAYSPNVFIYDKIQKTNKACYDMLGNVRFGYTSTGILKVGNILTGVNFSSHIGNWEHIYIKVDGNTFIYKSMDNSGEIIEASVQIPAFDFNILVSRYKDPSNGAVSDIYTNMILGAYEESGEMVTHDTIYRNLRTFIETSGSGLNDYYKSLSSPSINIKYESGSYDTDTIKVQSGLFYEKDLGE